MLGNKLLDFARGKYFLLRPGGPPGAGLFVAKKKFWGKSLKAQAALVDIVLLGTFISILLVYSFYSSNFSSNYKNTEEASYAESMMFSLMEYRNSTYGAFNNSGNMSFSEALGVYFCRAGLDETDLNGTVKYLLDRTASPLYNYIFYSSAVGQSGPQKQVWVWNSQSDVCASSITLTTFNLSLVCSTTDYFKPELGIWPKSKIIPPKSACSQNTSTSPSPT